MAFDQSTRNRLQKFVSESRSILTEEFTRQLQASYGMDPKNGTIAEIDTLNFLDNQGKQTATILRETLAHYVASLTGKSEKERTKQALDRIIREQAFTVLNRLGALRMAEARGFLLESISKGFSSKGFQLYKSLAGTALGETGDAYRQYLFSLFDEFSLDLAVLFDRHSPQGRLFPRESALLALLDEINHFEIEHLWAEDETIGWIYQYFNSQEERKKMRAESSAPRNSRELAVRNQFFTPRYVVEFLTDNTLGRIWYEMTQGKTALVDSCRYLVRRPTEIFLEKDEEAPENETEENESLSQEELLKQPVYIPFRPLKDPRELRMLDPACGSMHFGLYAFDLFEKIYEEAWLLESELGPDAFERENELEPLQGSFPDFEAFQKAIPKLIIEQNIHGVDIDPRAVQIAGLSLWQRAQRAWHQMGIKSNERPTIIKSNIVCAEPMPGEKELLREFTAKLNPPVLGQLVETIFDKMALAGEAGTLLKIEEEIKTAISDAKEAFNEELLRRKEQKDFLPGMAPKRQPTLFDFAELPDDTEFWDSAEDSILKALKDYADQAESGDGRKRLFAEDAAKGFAFMDLCRKRFDVVLMNPPFGSFSIFSGKYISKNYSDNGGNIFGSFIIRCSNLLQKKGKIGTITADTFKTLSSFKGFRKNLVSGIAYLDKYLDLGWGVLDDAQVSTAAYIISSCHMEEYITFYDVNDVEVDQKNSLLQNMVSLNRAEILSRVFMIKRSTILNLPGTILSYKLPLKVLVLYDRNSYTKGNLFEAFEGAGITGAEKYIRLWSEIPLETFNTNWLPLAHGGGFSPYYRPIRTVIDWWNDGYRPKQEIIYRYPYLNASYGFKIKHENMYCTKGLTYGKRTDWLNVSILPEGCVFSHEGQSIFSENIEKDWQIILAYLNSETIRSLINQLCESHKLAGYLNKLPWDSKLLDKLSGYKESVNAYVNLLKRRSSYNEENVDFRIPLILMNPQNNIIASATKILIHECESEVDVINYSKEIERIISDVLDGNKLSTSNTSRDNEYSENQILDSITNDARAPLFLERLMRDFNINPEQAYEIIRVNKNVFRPEITKQIYRLMSYMLGVFLGRWELAVTKNHHDFSGELREEDLFCRMFPKSIPLSPTTPLFKGHIVEQYSNKILGFIREFLERIWGGDANKVENEINEILKIKSTEEFFQKHKFFFDAHLKTYTTSRRTSPIYWPLQTPSCSYTLWVYYHRLTEQTLYTCVNDFVEPKLKIVSHDLNDLRNQSTRSKAEEKELTKLTDLEAELEDFQDELLRIAKFWKPNLNDGVQITAAPLWKLFQHKQWQKKLKQTWEKLEKGDYDWAHLACSIWPERVLGKCHEDRSLAIAHDVEDDFWEEIEVPVVRRGKDTGKTKMEWRPKALSENELSELIRQKMAKVKS